MKRSTYAREFIRDLHLSEILKNFVRPKVSLKVIEKRKELKTIDDIMESIEDYRNKKVG